MMDSGIRRGADIVIALCLGADFVFVGRSTLYGVAAAGEAGAARAITILRDEIDLTLAMIGCGAVDALGPSFLFRPLHPDIAAADPERAFSRL
jgi:L-lactate dehydrogenase (cytochrome)/(S)-mandelate dehydrogenase